MISNDMWRKINARQFDPPASQRVANTKAKVIELRAQGLRLEDIAQRLGICAGAVSNHLVGSGLVSLGRPGRKSRGETQA